MTTEEILEGNKLIAEFMGWQFIGMDRNSVWQNKQPVFKRGKKEPHLFLKAFEYHSSWDWLIPVYNKILKTLNDDKNLLLSIKGNPLINHIIKNVLDASSIDLQIHISSSFLKVVDIIKWYNTQNK